MEMTNQMQNSITNNTEPHENTNGPTNDNNLKTSIQNNNSSSEMDLVNAFPRIKEESGEESFSEDEQENSEMKKRGRNFLKSAPPQIINWLQDNFEPIEGSSLTRSLIYEQYLIFCNTINLEPLNSAGFGKLIHALFPYLKTRRLGTRGNSKYHYHGLRVKLSSPLFSTITSQMEEHNNYTSRKSRITKSSSQMSEMDLVSSSYPPPINERALSDSSKPIYLSSQSTIISSRFASSLPHFENQNHSQFGKPIVLPLFSIPQNFYIPEELSLELIQSFLSKYRHHCQCLVDSTYHHQFYEIEKYLLNFWGKLHPQYKMLLRYPQIIALINEKDHIAYTAITSVLLPNVLQILPVNVPQIIRQFAKQFEPWMITALQGLPIEFVSRKLNLVKKFAYTLHKQASLNHLTQAARAVLSNSYQVRQILIDWERLDFELIKEQASWVCQCKEGIFESTMADFKQFLIENVPLERWAEWLQDFVDQFMGRYTNLDQLTTISQQLLLKWSFFGTLILRDLTIRNAIAFGSFHLLRTLFDEYLSYLIESRLNQVGFNSVSNEQIVLPEPPIDSYTYDSVVHREHSTLLDLHYHTTSSSFPYRPVVPLTETQHLSNNNNNNNANSSNNNSSALTLNPLAPPPIESYTTQASHNSPSIIIQPSPNCLKRSSSSELIKPYAYSLSENMQVTRETQTSFSTHQSTNSFPTNHSYSFTNNSHLNSSSQTKKRKKDKK